VYGGNTTCFTLQTSQGMIIIDAGTGISTVSREIAALPQLPALTLLFTHFHLDHIVGLPSLEPLYNANAHVTLMADPRRPGKWKKTLTTFMGKPYWPIGLGDVDAAMKMKDLPVKSDSMELYGANIAWFRVPHPQQCLAFRLRTRDTDIVVATDVEYEPSRIAPAFVDFCRNTDFLIFDAQYLPAEYRAHRGWGHSTWEVAALAAARINAGQLILTHHAPERTDEEIETIVTSARRIFPTTVASAEGMVLSRQTRK
jgi:phosphoribosyl 1,2-cyclic phosphodiesterase